MLSKGFFFFLKINHIYVYGKCFDSSLQTCSQLMWNLFWDACHFGYITMPPHLQIQGDECEEVEGFPMDQFWGMVKLNKLKKNSIKDHKFKSTTLRLWYSWACLVKHVWNPGFLIQNSNWMGKCWGVVLVDTYN
jgi:hypothetical protein